MLLTSSSDSSACFSSFSFGHPPSSLRLFISAEPYVYLFLLCASVNSIHFISSLASCPMQCSPSCFLCLWSFFFFFCLLASLCLASSVSVSLLVFFWKITRSGAVRVHVFCAGYIDWMGWLHWAGFLCGPPANFMIYSAKGRGARPPVTTERELHVGLMISPQKCLLWLGLHGAQSPPTGWMVGRRWVGGGAVVGWKESSADRPESIQTLTTTHLLGGITREEEDGQKATSEWHVPNVLNSRPSTKCSASPACVLLFFITHSAIFLSPSLLPPHHHHHHHHHHDSCSQWEISEALLKCGHWGWCNQAFKNRERGRNNKGGDKVWVGWWLGGRRYLAYFSLLVSRSAGSREWLLRAWIWMLRSVLLLSLSVWLQLPQNKMMSFKGICEHSW